MSAISGFINTIRNAVYGEQVRGAIVSALEQCYSDVNNPSLNTEAFSAAIEAAYADGFLDIQEKSTIAGMTNRKIIYRYTGNEAGKQKGLYYYSALSDSWVLVGSEIQTVSNSSRMTDTNAIYKYTGTQTGMIQNALYYHDGTKWTPVASTSIVPPVPSGTVNAMLKCAMTYIDAANSGLLTYGDGTGSNQRAGTICCSTFARQLLQGIPYNDYKTQSATSTSYSGQRFRYGYRLETDPFENDATATAAQLYSMYWQKGRAWETDADMTGVQPGDFVVFGSSISDITHIGMFAFRRQDGTPYVIDATRRYDTVVHFHKQNSEYYNPVGYFRPDLTSVDFTAETVNISFTDESIFFASKTGYPSFLNLECNVTSGTEVAIGDMTFTPSRTGSTQIIFPVVGGEVSYSGCEISNACASRYITANILDNHKINSDIENIKEFIGYTDDSGIVVDYNDLQQFYSYPSYSHNFISCVDVVGSSLSSAFVYDETSEVKNFKIPVDDVETLSYALFKSSSNFGCVFIDSVENVVWAYSNPTLTTGTMKEVDVPSDAAYFIFSVPPSMQSNTSIIKVVLGEAVRVNETDKLKALSTLKINYLPYASTLSSFKKRSLALCGIKTEIVDNKIPFPEGYLFEELGTDESNKLYFGSRLDNAVEVGTMTFNVRDYQFAISPTDGRIIACHRTQRNAMYVWDGETITTLFSSASTKPKAWLYNSGVDFIIDGNGNECCVFAEYDPQGGSGNVFNVWKGVYPYTSESDWSIVFTMQGADSQTADTVTHFHQIRRDPWTNVLYLTSGDRPKQLRWWYSTDYGDNWTLLTDNANNGWEEHVCRCINFIFTEDYIYWAVDHGTNHSLNRISRNASTGIIDISTRRKLADLPFAQATNTVCYVDRPNGLFMFERIDTGTEYKQYYGGTIKQLFYSFDCNALIEVGTIKLTNNSWGGHRGQCYTNYCTGQEPHPAMGYSIFTPCVFDIIGASNGLGTIYYDL